MTDAGKASDLEFKEAVLQAMEECTAFTRDMLTERTRRRDLVEMRYLLFFILARNTHLNYTEIGQIGGRRWDHSTVSHGIIQATAWMQYDAKFSDLYRVIIDKSFEIIKKRNQIDEPEEDKPINLSRVSIKKNKRAKYPYTDLYSKVLEARLKQPCLAELPFHPTRKFRFDYAFPDVKIAIEIDGGIWQGERGQHAGRHSGGVGQVKDMEKMNLAAEMGWLVFHYTPQQKMKPETFIQLWNAIKNRKNATEPK